MNNQSKILKSFDSYHEYDSDRIVIITMEYCDIHEKIMPTLNHISVERAKEIVKDLQKAIRLQSMKAGNKGKNDQSKKV